MLADYYARGASVIYYQHKARRKDDYYIKQHMRLLAGKEFGGASGPGLKFIPVSQRYYFFILQQKHEAVVMNVVEKMLKTAWRDCFSLLPGLPFSTCMT